MELIVKKFNELSIDELYEILKLRADIFIIEQNCPYADIDNKDQFAYHVYLRDGDGIQAYLRVIEAGVAFEEAAIGRVIARKRRCGLGTQILYAGIEVAKNRMNASRIKIEAQTYARSFYEQVGFRQSSEEFLEDGIPHIEMILNII